ncbi:MAG: alkaline phosphatase family protein [archaeon]
MKKKLLLIGIDGMSPILVEKWKKILPNMSKLNLYYSNSVFPPDSIPAWISIFTGKNPAEHGVIESIDYLDIQKKEFELDHDTYRGKTFWDKLSQKGKKVCVINPFLAYPPWKVNGVMISGQVFVDGNSKSFPEKFLEKYPSPALGGIEDFPKDTTLKEFIYKTKEDSLTLKDYGIRLLKKQDWDLYFITFLTLDRIQHFLWRYMDKEDRDYPGDNEFYDEIKKMYILFDEIIGEYMINVEKDTKIMIFSDHGHGRRCQKCFNVNELLRQNGYLKTNSNSKFSPYKFIEKSKNKTLELMHKYNLTDWIIKISKFIPNKKSLQKSTYLIDKDNSLVYASDFAGTNPFGGIIINRKKIKEEGLDYKNIENEIIKLLSSFEIDGKNIVTWIKPKKEIMEGKFIGKLPDLLVQLDEDYGFNWTLFNNVVSVNPTHKKISGGHKQEGILLTNLKIDKGIGIDKYYQLILDYFDEKKNLISLQKNMRVNEK